MTDLNVDAVLFDLDGTLIDSTLATEAAWNTWGERMGVEGFRYDHHGVPARDIVAMYIEPERRSEALDLIDALEAADVHGIVAKPGASRLLAAVPADRRAIVTSGIRVLAEARIVAAGLEIPDVMVTADMVTDGKPDPEGFVTAAHRLGIAPERCLVIEDAAPGVEAGGAAGAATLAVVGTTAAAELDADYVVDTLEQVTVRVETDGSLAVSIAAMP